MIPEADIVLHEMNLTPAFVDDWDAVDEVTYYYQWFVAKLIQLKDPFFLIKKKCPLTFPPAGIPYDTQELQYIAIPFPETKIRSVSFEKRTMNNLMLGPDDIVYQLLYVTESSSPPREWSVVLRVVEYRTPLWIFLARKIIPE